ncbi:MAG TPA: glycosyltransferase family 4 protein [Acidimicrobiales bacterium]|nr:glycosyltransferase family 4 protein [Acidimicrobiales bacterium]
MRVAHLTTVDTSLRYLLLPQLLAVVAEGGVAIGISAPGDSVDHLAGLGIEHRPLASSTRSADLRADLRAAAELWSVLRREHFDVLHTHNPKPGLYGRVLGRLAGVPVVVHTTHGLYATTEDRWPKRLAVYLAEALAARFSHAELVQNPEDLALMTRLHILPRGRGVLLGNGIDLERFDPDRHGNARAVMRRRLGIGDDQLVVGTVGRLVAEKGHRELFEAMTLLDRHYQLVVVGPEDPEKADALPAEVLDAARARGVRLLGMRSDVEELYAAMDIFVLASHREGFPRAAMEAAAMGLPVVATDIRGCREIVVDGDNGLLVRPRDPAALAAAIARLGPDAGLRARMGARGRARARTDFDERQVVARVLDTYAQILQAGPSGRRRRARATPRGRSCGRG